MAALGADARIPALALAQRLRDVGLRAEMDHTGRSLKAQFKHADKLGAPRLVMVGGDELARGTVRVRDMQTREEIEIPLESAAKILAGGKEEC